MAKIDVILPVRNGIDFLAESVESIINQTFSDWRLLILDHGSTDGSLELSREYHKNDSRIEVFPFPEAKGLSGLLNKGLEICDCEYVMRHDADDIAYPNRMEITLRAFENQPDVILVGGQALEIDSEGNERIIISMPVGSARFTAAGFFRSPFIHPAITMKFEAISKFNIRYGVDFLNVLPEHEKLSVDGLAEDYIMFGQMALIGKCTNIPETLIKYRWHANNVSKTRYEDQINTCTEISRYLAKCFSQIQSVPYFDPAPFCNHGGVLLNVNDQTDFTSEFEAMQKILHKGLGLSLDLQRELAYRKVISTRNEAKLAWRYYNFQRKYQVETGEWYAVRAWLLRNFPGKREFQAEPDNFKPRYKGLDMLPIS